MPSIEQVSFAKAEASKRAESFRLSRMSGRKQGKATSPSNKTTVNEQVKTFMTTKVEEKIDFILQEPVQPQQVQPQPVQPQQVQPQQVQQPQYLQHVHSKDNSEQISHPVTEFFLQSNIRKFQIPLIVRNILIVVSGVLIGAIAGYQSATWKRTAVIESKAIVKTDCVVPQALVVPQAPVVALPDPISLSNKVVSKSDTGNIEPESLNPNYSTKLSSKNISQLSKNASYSRNRNQSQTPKPIVLPPNVQQVASLSSTSKHNQSINLDGNASLLAQPGQKYSNQQNQEEIFDFNIKRPNNVAVTNNSTENIDASNKRSKNGFKIVSYQDNFITVRSKSSVRNIKIGEEMSDGKILKSIGANSYSAE